MNGSMFPFGGTVLFKFDKDPRTIPIAFISIGAPTVFPTYCEVYIGEMTGSVSTANSYTADLYVVRQAGKSNKKEC